MRKIFSPIGSTVSEKSCTPTSKTFFWKKLVQSFRSILYIVKDFFQLTSNCLFQGHVIYPPFLRHPLTIQSGAVYGSFFPLVYSPALYGWISCNIPTFPLIARRFSQPRFVKLKGLYIFERRKVNFLPLCAELKRPSMMPTWLYSRPIKASSSRLPAEKPHISFSSELYTGIIKER